MEILITLLVIGASIGIYFTITKYFGRKENTAPTPPNNTTPAPTPRPNSEPITYYVLHPCPFKQNRKFLTTTKITQSGQRVLSGAGKNYVWAANTTTNVEDGTFIGEVQVLEGKSGCG